MKNINCLLCDNNNCLEVNLAGKNYYKCNNCDLLFMAPSHFISYDDEKERYLSHQNHMGNVGYVKMFYRIIEPLKTICNSILTTLDYGCGHTQVLVELLQKEGFKSTGYDPFFFPKLPDTEQFDSIISTEAFEHFKDPTKEIKQILKIITPNGYLAIMTQFMKDDIELEKWWYLKDRTHITFYSLDTFSWISKKYNLKTVYCNNRDIIIFQLQDS